MPEPLTEVAFPQPKGWIEFRGSLWLADVVTGTVNSLRISKTQIRSNRCQQVCGLLLSIHFTDFPVPDEIQSVFGIFGIL